MKSYIIRIYRGEKGDSKEFLGTVERPGEDVKLAFTSFEELKDILDLREGKDFFVKLQEQQKGRQPNQGAIEAGDQGPKANQEETMGKKKKEDEEGWKRV